jgi:hypothetical protein
MFRIPNDPEDEYFDENDEKFDQNQSETLEHIINNFLNNTPVNQKLIIKG